MGSANRPPRRARSSKASYKDSCSEDEDGDFSVAHEPTTIKASESKDFSRRSLALKRVSRSQERAEALQIQKAIEDSLSPSEVNENANQAITNAFDDSKEVDDSEEDVPNIQVPRSLLSEECQEQWMQIPPNEIVDKEDESTGQVVVYSSRQKKTEALNISPKGSKAAGEDDVDWSCEDDSDDDVDDENVTEDESSDASEDFKPKRKGAAKFQKSGKKVAGIAGKEQKLPSALVKRPRSSRGPPEAGARLTSKKKQGVGVKPLAHARLTDCKDVTSGSSLFETKEKHVLISRESKELRKRGLQLKGCKSALVDAKMGALISNAKAVDGEIPGFAAQSPTGLHRRVIGLSRRFKPPPLHPYLPRMEG